MPLTNIQPMARYVAQYLWEYVFLNSYTMKYFLTSSFCFLAMAFLQAQTATISALRQSSMHVSSTLQLKESQVLFHRLDSIASFSTAFGGNSLSYTRRFQYNDDHRLIYRDWIYADEQSSSMNMRYLSTVNNNGFTTAEALEIWDASQEAWLPTANYSITYDPQGRISQWLEQVYDIEQGEYTDSYRVNYSYSEDGWSEISSLFDGDQWTPVSGNVYRIFSDEFFASYALGDGNQDAVLDTSSRQVYTLQPDGITREIVLETYVSPGNYTLVATGREILDQYGNTIQFIIDPPLMGGWSGSMMEYEYDYTVSADECIVAGEVTQLPQSYVTIFGVYHKRLSETFFVFNEEDGEYEEQFRNIYYYTQADLPAQVMDQVLPEVVLSPNPCVDEVFITGNVTGGFFEVVVADLSGKVVLRQQVSDGAPLSMLSLAPGVYVCSVVANRNTTVHKVIKE